MLRKMLGGAFATILAIYMLGSISGPVAPGLSGFKFAMPTHAEAQQPQPTIIDVLNAPRNSHVPTLPPPSDYQAFCTDEWTKRGVTDFEMQKYCVDKERDGYAELGAAVRQYGGLFWLDRVLQAAEGKWTKRGVRQDSMVSYELKRQMEAFLDFQYMLKQPGFVENVATACLGEWTKNGAPDWPMTEYCYKQQLGNN